MTRPSPFRSGAFRLALFFAAVFALGSVALVVAIETAVARYAAQVTTDTLLTETTRLASTDRLHGRRAVIDAIAAPSRLGRRQFHYLLVNSQREQTAGDLPTSADRVGWGTVRVTEPGTADDPGDQPAPMKTLGVDLNDGGRLVVGSDTYDVQELREWLDTVAVWSGIAITLLALITGYLIASLFTRRLERLNMAVARIMAGDLGERLPVIRMGAEFDHLSANLNRMLDRIEALMDSVRQVSTSIAHDLRTPLTRLRQHLEAASSSPSRPVAHVIEEAIFQIDAIMMIFGSLLRIGTLEAGVGRSRFHPVDLSEIVQRVLLAYQPVAEDGGRTLGGSVEPGIIVAGDRGLLAQMFTNLVENTLVHTLPGSTIMLTLMREAGAVVATVGDNGPGIPATERQNVLKRFFRLDPSRAGSGAGLGLALVAAIVALHDAELTLEDNRPGLLLRLRWQVPPRAATPVRQTIGDRPAACFL